VLGDVTAKAEASAEAAKTEREAAVKRCLIALSASELRGNNLKCFKYFYLKAKARIWP